MRDANPILVFVGGMAACMVMFVGLVWMGPSVIPGQFDQCQAQLRKAQPNCSTRERGGFTYIRESRCINPTRGLMLLAQDDSGWWRLGRLPKPDALESEEDTDSDADAD